MQINPLRAHIDPAVITSGAGLTVLNPDRVDAIHNDFIPHPAGFPIRFRRAGLFERFQPQADIDAPAGDVGLSVRADKYIAAGSAIELEIPLRGETQRFRATVVLVREVAEGYELGLWFHNPDDATRARIVEKICHTECYLRTRRQFSN